MPYVLILAGVLSLIPVGYVFVLGLSGEFNGLADYAAMTIRQIIVLLIFGSVPFSLIYGGIQRLEQPEED